MRRSLTVIAALLLGGSLLLVAQAPRGRGQAADPTTPVLWNAQRIKELAAGMKTRVNPNTHNAAMSLIASANLIYRDGDSGSEVHEKVADFIFVHEGEGAIMIGGKIIGGQSTAPNEIRGTSLEGGTRHPIAAGDSIYIPANMPHQFFVEKGKHFVITIVKVPPKS
jgi:mannose-6-phosphate isomerase-like protein (cupin superfamily)